MSFTRNIFTLSIMVATALNAPLLLANEVKPNIDLANYDEEFDDSLEDFYGDEDFVSIATGTKKAIHKAPSVATVITSDDIQAMGANSIHQIIETVTGIHTYPSNFNIMNPSYSIRGIHTAENSQVLILVNGVRTTFAFNGAKWSIFDLGVNLIDRVEVIRGPGSAVYGADAYSGVINIITKGTENIFQNDAGIKTGSFNTNSAWFNYGYQQNALKLSFNGQWQESSGDSSRIVQTDLLHLLGLSALSNAPGPLDTRHRYVDLHAQFDYKGAYANLWHLDIEGGAGAGAAQALSNSDKVTGKQTNIELGYKTAITDNFTIDISVFHQKYEHITYFKIFPDGYIDTDGVEYTKGYIGAPEAKDTNSGFKLTSTYSGINQHDFRVELGYKNTKEITDEAKNFGPEIIEVGQTTQDDTLTSVRGTPYIFIGDNDRRLSYISLQDEWAFASDWEFTAGIRYDNYSDFGSTVNPRLALVWQTQHNLTTKLLYGSAFRAPSFGELFSTNNPVLLGNPELKAEEIDTWDLAFDYRPNFDYKILFNIYKYQASGLISIVAGKKQNALKQNGIGSELEAHWQLNDQLKVKIGYAWQGAEDSDNNAIADAPQDTFDVNIQWKIMPDLTLYAASFWLKNRERATTDLRPNIEDYNLTNLTLNYTGLDNITLTFSAKNIFDSNAREASNGFITKDYPLAERGYWLTAKVNY
ncbi:MAG: TonB-dependent receptor [Colwellia sp.]|nr:TonB-dependent receptor [Colwellia sp.]